jgi:Ran GTPase-activating protein (RanGAP) involved in mRNA processing and transport
VSTELADLLAWLRAGTPAETRIDFPTGTALPDGRLDLCKQDLGPAGAARIAAALPGIGVGPGADAPVRHLLLGTDGLGDQGADAVSARTPGTGVNTLYLGCNKITTAGVCRVADNLRASPHVVKALWLKRNPLGPGAGHAAAAVLDAAPQLRTLDLVQTGLTPAGLAELVGALLAGHAAGRKFERVYLGGNPLGPSAARILAPVIEVGAVAEIYLSAAGLGDSGALDLADALRAAPYGTLRRLSLASNGIGPSAIAALVTACTDAGVELLDLGRVRAAALLAAPDNRIDEPAATAIGRSLSAAPHRLTHLVLTHTGLRSREAHRLLDHAEHAATPTRYVLGNAIAATVKQRLRTLSAEVPPPEVPADVAGTVSVYRTAWPEAP